MRHLFVSILLLTTLAAVAGAQYVGPPPREMTFRLYGKGARPISSSDTAYQVSMQRWLPDAQSNLLKKYTIPFKRIGDTVSLYTIWNSSSYGSYLMEIDYQGERMRVMTDDGIDSIGFAPGDYWIAGLYQNIFGFRKGAGVEITPTFADFKVRSFERGDGTMLSADSAPHPALSLCRQNSASAAFLSAEDEDQTRMNITNVVAVPGGGGVIAVVQEGFPKRRTILVTTTDTGKNWSRIPYAFSTDTILAIHFADSRTGVIYALDPSRQKVVSISNDGGHSWKRLPVPTNFDREVWSHSPDADTIRINGSTAFRIFEKQLSRQDRWRLEKTVDSGRSWNLILANNGDGEEIHNAPGGERLHFLNDRYGVMMTNEYLMITRDQGMHWQYQPFGGAWGMSQGNGPCGPFLLQDFAFIDERTLCAFYFGWVRFIRLE